ncbi:hypothetical protein PRI8871_02274 [Pseudoprimorskyibacter insulae]|uniref:Uncharacterized protein n=2 Tax=Pseudoprimorskyibacter insulae TaxID=1695997 RepID=A0A2R8AX72_9RHOB|nr:hypothetical protein PRI8871_02274 [Pseudoprimorskyibacter insulae]
MSFPTTHAVLTGDFIDSRRADLVSLDTAMEALSSAMPVLAEDSGLDLPLPFHRFRGDGWQVFHPDPQASLRTALRLIARLAASGTGLKTRIAIGIGQATLSADHNLATSHGPAFVQAGLLLDDMDRTDRLILAYDAGQMHCAMTGLVDVMSRSWTKAQGEALFLALASGDEPTQEEIAKHLGVTRQAIQQRLAATGHNQLKEALYAFEATLRDPS